MASPNIIMSENCSMRITNFNSSSKYDIAELNFYIPNSRATDDDQCFLIIKNTKNVTEIIELYKIGAQGSNTLYKLPLNQQLRIQDGTVSIYYVILNSKTDNYIISSKVNINITVDRYELARQVYLAQQVNTNTARLYAQICNITEHIENMYNELKERG